MPGRSLGLLLPETQSLGDPREGTQDPSAASTATGKSVLLSGEMKAVLLEERKPLLAFQAGHRSRHLSHRRARETQKDTAAGSRGHPRDWGPDFLGPGVSWPEWESPRGELLAPRGLLPAAHPPTERAAEGTFYKCVLREVGPQPWAHSLGVLLGDRLTWADKKQVEASAGAPCAPAGEAVMLLHVRP